MAGLAAPHRRPLDATQRVPGLENSDQGCGESGTTCWLLAPSRERWYLMVFSHSSLLSAIRMLPVPRTPTAFRFLAPRVAPPPAECDTELMTTDIGTRFSPAWPMHATAASGPISWLISYVARRMPWPQRWRASRISTLPSAMESHTGRSARPSTMTASYPAYFSSAAKWPPMCPLATSGVGQQVGHSVVMAVRPLQGAPVPARGPVAKTTLFSGSNGLVPAGTSSQRTL